MFLCSDLTLEFCPLQVFDSLSTFHTFDSHLESLSSLPLIQLNLSFLPLTTCGMSFALDYDGIPYLPDYH
jgi:hypothetical protein